MMENQPQQGRQRFSDNFYNGVTYFGVALSVLEKNPDGLDFKHPFEDDGSWKTMNCVDCHSGGS